MIKQFINNFAIFINYSMYDILKLNEMLVSELHEIASRLGIRNFEKLDKQNLILQE